MTKIFPLIDPPKGMMRTGVLCPVPNTDILPASRVLVWSPPTDWVTLMLTREMFNDALILAAVNRDRVMLRPTLADRLLIERPTNKVYFGDFCYE